MAENKMKTKDYQSKLERRLKEYDGPREPRKIFIPEDRDADNHYRSGMIDRGEKLLRQNTAQAFQNTEKKADRRYRIENAESIYESQKAMDLARVKRELSYLDSVRTFRSSIGIDKSEAMETAQLAQEKIEAINYINTAAFEQLMDSSENYMLCVDSGMTPAEAKGRFFSFRSVDEHIAVIQKCFSLFPESNKPSISKEELDKLSKELSKEKYTGKKGPDRISEISESLRAIDLADFTRETLLHNSSEFNLNSAAANADGAKTNAEQLIKNINSINCTVLNSMINSCDRYVKCISKGMTAEEAKAVFLNHNSIEKTVNDMQKIYHMFPADAKPNRVTQEHINYIAQALADVTYNDQSELIKNIKPDFYINNYNYDISAKVDENGRCLVCTPLSVNESGMEEAYRRSGLESKFKNRPFREPGSNHTILNDYDSEFNVYLNTYIETNGIVSSDITVQFKDSFGTIQPGYNETIPGNLVIGIDEQAALHRTLSKVLMTRDDISVRGRSAEISNQDMLDKIRKSLDNEDSKPSLQEKKQPKKRLTNLGR